MEVFNATNTPQWRDPDCFVGTKCLGAHTLREAAGGTPALANGR